MRRCRTICAVFSVLVAVAARAQTDAPADGPPDDAAFAQPALPDQFAEGETGGATPQGLTSNGVSFSANLVWMELARGAVTMSEGVRAEYQGTIITADRCDYDTDRDIALFYPYIVLEREGERMVAEECEFRPRDKTWTLRNATVEISPRYLNNVTTDYVYLHAQTIEGDDDRAELRDAYLTTSPRARILRDTETGLLIPQKPPQWTLRTDRIRLEHRGNYIVLGPSTLYIAKVPIFWVPGVGISRSLLRNVRYLPEVGQNASDGWYFRWAYPYYRDNLARIGYSQKQGMSYGLEYRHRGDPTSYSAVVNYRVQSKSFTGDLDFSTRVFGGSLSASHQIARASAIQDTLSTTEDTSAAYTLNSGRHALSLNGSRNATTTTQRRSTASASGDYRYRLSDSTDFQATSRYSANDVTDPTDSAALVANEELNTVFRLASRQSWADLEISHEKRSDPDGDRYTLDDSYGYVDKTPEITLRTDLDRLGIGSGPWSVDLDAAATDLSETATSTRLWRYALDADARRSVISFGKTQVTLAGKYAQRYYQDGTANYTMTGRTGVTTRWSDQLTSVFSWNYINASGYSPFRSDMLQRSHTASGSLKWSHRGSGSDQNASLDVSRDLRLGRWSDLRFSYGWRGSAGNSLTLSTTYDMEDHAFRQASVIYNTRAIRSFDWQVSTGYDFRTDKITPVRSQLDWMIDPDSWRVRWTASYTPSRNRFDQTTVQLIHYTQAFTYAVSYNSQRRDFRFSISVRGLPNLVSEGFGVGSSGELLSPATGGGGYF